MSRRARVSAVIFAVASGVYWYFIGQILPIAVPMMLNDAAMLLRMMVETLVALVFYVALAMLFFHWLLSRPRS